MHRYHLIAVGGEEVERSIAKSALNPSKKVWSKYLQTIVGPDYIPLKSHALQVHIYISDLTCICICVCVHACLCVHACMCMHVCVRMYVFLYVYLSLYANNIIIIIYRQFI